VTLLKAAPGKAGSSLRQLNLGSLQKMVIVLQLVSLLWASKEHVLCPPDTCMHLNKDCAKGLWLYISFSILASYIRS